VKREMRAVLCGGTVSELVARRPEVRDAGVVGSAPWLWWVRTQPNVAISCWRDGLPGDEGALQAGVTVSCNAMLGVLVHYAGCGLLAGL